MISSGAVCIAYETVMNDKDGALPLLTPMSEVAGRLSVQEGAKYLEKPQGGKGILLGGVPGVKPAEVVVIGAGVVGHTEYSSIKWALYQMAEYVNMMTASAVISTLFLGGYRGPRFLDAVIPGISEWPIIWLVLKMAIFMFMFIWLKATLPRLRYDQLMRFGWLYLFEFALLSALITGAVIAFVL